MRAIIWLTCCLIVGFWIGFFCFHPTNNIPTQKFMNGGEYIKVLERKIDSLSNEIEIRQDLYDGREQLLQNRIDELEEKEDVNAFNAMINRK